MRNNWNDFAEGFEEFCNFLDNPELEETNNIYSKAAKKLLIIYATKKIRS